MLFETCDCQLEPNEVIDEVNKHLSCYYCVAEPLPPAFANLSVYALSN